MQNVHGAARVLKLDVYATKMEQRSFYVIQI